jgi:hypothetical protein
MTKLRSWSHKQLLRTSLKIMTTWTRGEAEWLNALSETLFGADHASADATSPDNAAIGLEVGGGAAVADGAALFTDIGIAEEMDGSGAPSAFDVHVLPTSERAWISVIAAAIDAFFVRHDTFNTLPAFVKVKGSPHLVRWCHRVAPLPREVPLSMLRLPSGEVKFIFFSKAKMDPEVIFSLANRTVVAGMGYVMRGDSLGRLIYPMHAWNPKQDLSGLDLISPSIGIVLLKTGRQAPPGHSLRLREMIQFCDSHLCSTLVSSCFVSFFSDILAGL